MNFGFLQKIKTIFISFLILFPIPALARDQNIVFLSCNAVRNYIRHYGGIMQRTVLEDLFLKINLRNPEFHIFNADSHTYQNRCTRIRSRPNQGTIGDTESVCRISGEMVSISYVAIGLGGVIWESYYVHRGSGRIEGSVRVYMGGSPTLSVFELASRDPSVDYNINGFCQIGQDMRNNRRAF